MSNINEDTTFGYPWRLSDIIQRAEEEHTTILTVDQAKEVAEQIEALQDKSGRVVTWDLIDEVLDPYCENLANEEFFANGGKDDEDE